MKPKCGCDCFGLGSCKSKKMIVGSIFNREFYEVFEFEIDMVNYIEEKFTVEITNS
jgi:hypothetical protein